MQTLISVKLVYKKSVILSVLVKLSRFALVNNLIHISGLFELLRDHFTPPGGTIAQISSPALFASGGIAGFFYWFLTYPADVIKSTLMSESEDPSKRRFHGIFQCARYLYRQEGGIKRFFRGFTPCLLRSIPANAVMLFTLEKSRQFLSKY